VSLLIVFHMHKGSHLYVLKPLKSSYPLSLLSVSFFISTSSSSPEEVVSLLVSILVGHLLEPRLAHVSLRCELFVLQLIVFSLLNSHSVVQTLVIQVSLFGTLNVSGLILVRKLVLQAVVLPVDFRLFGVAHLLDNLLGLFGAEVRLVVLLVVVPVFGALLPSPLHLHVDKVLVLLLVDASLGLGLP